MTAPRQMSAKQLIRMATTPSVEELGCAHERLEQHRNDKWRATHSTSLNAYSVLSSASNPDSSAHVAFNTQRPTTKGKGNRMRHLARQDPNQSSQVVHRAAQGHQNDLFTRLHHRQLPPQIPQLARQLAHTPVLSTRCTTISIVTKRASSVAS